MPGGVGDYCARLLHAIGARQNSALEIVVLTMRNGALTMLDSASPLAQFGDMPDWGWGIWRPVRAALRSWKPDVLHIQYQTGAYAMHPAINLLPALLRHIGPRPALVVTAHDLLLPYLAPKASWLREWVTYRLMADSDALVVTNSDDLQRVRGGAGAAVMSATAGLPVYQARRKLPGHVHVHMIPIGTNIEAVMLAGYTRAAWRQQLGCDSETLLLAFFGLISHSKGLDIVLDALEQLPAHVRLILIGGEAAAPQDQAYAEKLRMRIQSSPLQQRVYITGHCSAEDVSAHLLAADLAVLPFKDGASFRRGSLLAALAHGLPTITTQPRSIPELRPQLIDDQNVVLVPINNAAALASAISGLALEPARRMRLAEGARQLAAYFSWHDIAEQHIHVYRQLTNK